MIISDEARAERKRQQLARLEAKALAAETGDWSSYREFYENQPVQKAKKEHNKKISKARQDVKKAQKDVDLARVQGGDIEAALQALNVAKVTLASLERQKEIYWGRNPGATVSGGDA